MKKRFLLAADSQIVCEWYSANQRLKIVKQGYIGKGLKAIDRRNTGIRRRKVLKKQDTAFN